MYSNFFIILCGPTGVGKSDLSYELMKEFPIEIINGDMGQLYKPLSIGTAKPNSDTISLKHHLFDYIEKPHYFTAMEYRCLVQKKLKEVWQRGSLPVIVGGSFFYLKALFFESQSCETATSHNFDLYTNEELWAKLHEIDGLRAQSLKINDRYRIERALTIWEKTGNLPSLYVPQFSPLGKCLLIFITRDRIDLYQRINDRVRHMFAEGWVEEVASLPVEWQTFLMKKKILGYPDIIENLKNSHSLMTTKDELLIEKIQQKTRNYAKRQITFWKSFKREIQEKGSLVDVCDLTITELSLGECSKKIKVLIKKETKNG